MNTDKSNSVNDPHLDSVRLLSNYLIVLMHAWAAGQYCSINAEYRAWNFICNALTTVAMPTLFFLSGFLLMRNFKLSSFPKKLARRVKRLAVPFVAWNVSFVSFYLAMERIVPRLSERVNGFHLHTLSGVLDKTISFMGAPIDLPTWFLRTLFVYSILGLLFYILLKHRSAWLMYLLVFAWGALTLWFNWGKALRFTYPFYSLLCFVFGCHLSIRNCSPVSFFQSKCWMFLPIAGFALMGYFIVNYQFRYHVIRDVAFMMELPLLFSIAPDITHCLKRVPHVDFLKQSSFFLYAGHLLFCGSVLHLIAPRFAFLGGGKLFVLIVIFCTVGVAVNLGAYWIGKRLFGKWFGIWDGSL